jgi:hypothetical protein
MSDPFQLSFETGRKEADPSPRPIGNGRGEVVKVMRAGCKGSGGRGKDPVRGWRRVGRDVEGDDDPEGKGEGEGGEGCVWETRGGTSAVDEAVEVREGLLVTSARGVMSFMVAWAGVVEVIGSKRSLGQPKEEDVS